MNKREETKNKLLESIDHLKIDHQSKIEKILEPRISTIFETEYLDSYKGTNDNFPIEKSFKSSKVNRIFLTILFSVISLAPFLTKNTSIKDSFFFSIFITLVFCLPIALYIWSTEKLKNKLTLNNQGILFNNEFYKWSNILTTHIEFINNGRNRDKEGFLLLGLDSGQIKVLDISFINFTSFIWDSNIYNARVLGHYIEVYKKNSL